MLTSEFVAQHIAAAFRWPSYLILIHCGGQIAYREAGATNVLVASKVAALCVVVLAALTAFGIAAIGAQIASGQPALDLAGCAYALYINFGCPYSSWGGVRSHSGHVARRSPGSVDSSMCLWTCCAASGSAC